MVKVKVIYDRENCIGAGSCAAVCPKYWRMAEDNKADLLGSKKNNKIGKHELELEASEEEFTCLKDSANACPVQVIKVAEEK